MQTQQFKELIEKYLNETIRAEEKQQLAAMLQDPSYFALLDEMVLEQLVTRAYAFEPDLAIQQSIDEYIDERTSPPVRRVHFLRASWVRSAAAVLLIIGSSAMFVYKLTHKEKMEPIASARVDIQPGGNKAVLTLADGSSIILDSTRTGPLAQQGNARVITKKGQLAYNEIGNGSAIVHNTMTTPKGGQYQLLLSDGTKVWLNAASSITYPTAFTEKERKVSVTGEAYFEVAQNIHQPFKVEVADAVIEVLGTSFNINAYPDETTINTTLLTGKVLVHTQEKPAILSPGQQAQVERAGGKIKVSNGDAEQAIAWKNGLFSFKDADIYAVMRQISRWYNVEIIYNEKVQPVLFSGDIGRDLTLSNVLSGLERVNIHFKIEENKRILILP
jgi:transmembrane sensor